MKGGFGSNRDRAHASLNVRSGNSTARSRRPAFGPVLTGGKALLSVPVAGWMADLIRSSARFGRRWPVSGPYADRIAGIADAVGAYTKALAAAMLAIDTIFDPELAANGDFRKAVIAALDGLFCDDPIAFVRQVCALPAAARLKRPAQSA